MSAIIPIVMPLYYGNEGSMRSRFVIVFRSLNELKRALAIAYNEVYNSNEIQLEEKHHKGYRVEYVIKYRFNGKLKKESRFKVFNYHGKYYVLVANLASPYIDPDGYLIVHLINEYLKEKES